MNAIFRTLGTVRTHQRTTVHEMLRSLLDRPTVTLDQYLRSLAETREVVEVDLDPGTYRWENEFQVDARDTPEELHIRGQPGVKIDVEIAADTAAMMRLGTIRNPFPRVHISDLEIDIGDGDPARDAGIYRAYISDRLTVDNVSLTRRCRLNKNGTRNGDRHTLLTCCTEPDATAELRNVDLTAGDTHRPSQRSVGHAIPFAAEPPHVGTTRYINCAVAGYVDNGFYVRDGVGANIMDGCMARNTGGAAFRLGKHDSLRDSRAIFDGKETPADGAALWIQDSEGTSVNGLRIYAPGMDNDMIRTSGRQLGATVSDVYAILGDVGEYSMKLRGNGRRGGVTFNNVTVEDDCDGYIRESSVNIGCENVTFNDCRILNGGGRIPFAFRAPNARVKDSLVRMNGSRLARLGSVLASGETVHARFEGCTFEGPTYREMFTENRNPDRRWLILDTCDFTDADFTDLGASLHAYDNSRLQYVDGFDR